VAATKAQQPLSTPTALCGVTIDPRYQKPGDSNLPLSHCSAGGNPGTVSLAVQMAGIFDTALVQAAPNQHSGFWILSSVIWYMDSCLRRDDKNMAALYFQT
jgi:hypothetical protein